MRIMRWHLRNRSKIRIFQRVSAADIPTMLTSLTLFEAVQRERYYPRQFRLYLGEL